MSELDDYDYHLPPELIAQEPLPGRSDARLLVVDRQTQSLRHRRVGDLPDLLAAGDCLVLNDTRVVPARLLGHRTQSGGRWEGLFVAPADAGTWLVLGKSRRKLHPGESITIVDHEGRPGLELRLLDQLPGGEWLVQPLSELSPWQLLEKFGHVPLPPYIRQGRASVADQLRYQTVYAREPGSVAAPTAGLHFTERLLSQLIDVGVFVTRVTLHVGPGTFKPIKVERLAEHVMHAEWGEVTAEAATRIAACRAAGGRIIAVGTTSTRVLETAAQQGAGEESTGPSSAGHRIAWPSSAVPRDGDDSLERPSYGKGGGNAKDRGSAVQPWQGNTNLFIRPPYAFRAIDGLLTNFHLPKSTLLVLVRTLGGDDLIRRAYDEAIREGYRFYSYGDAMLVL